MAPPPAFIRAFGLDDAGAAAAIAEAAAWSARPSLLARLLVPVEARLAAAPPRCTLVLDPGRGRTARGVAAVLHAAPGRPEGARVIAVANAPDAQSPASGTELDDAAVEHHADRLPLDLRAETGDRLPLEAEEAGSVDAAVLLGRLGRTTRPVDELRRLHPWLAPAARVLVIEDDRPSLRLHPPCPHVETAWTWMLRSRAERGLDPGAGRRAAALLDHAGFIPQQAGQIDLGGLADGDHGQSLQATILDLLAADATASGPAGRADAPPLLEEGDGASAVTRVHEAMARWAERPGATIWWTATWVEAIPEPRG